MFRSFFRLRVVPKCSQIRQLSQDLRRQELKNKLLDAKAKHGVTYKELAQKLKVNKVWLTSVIHGEHPADPKLAASLLDALQIYDESQYQDIETLCRIPENRGCRDQTLTKDPIVRRFDELLDVYGDAFKAIIREEAGDGIMSAIDCTVNFETIKKGDEIRLVLNVDGKFLKYKH